MNKNLIHLKSIGENNVWIHGTHIKMVNQRVFKPSRSISQTTKFVLDLRTDLHNDTKITVTIVLLNYIHLNYWNYFKNGILSKYNRITVPHQNLWQSQKKCVPLQQWHVAWCSPRCQLISEMHLEPLNYENKIVLPSELSVWLIYDSKMVLNSSTRDKFFMCLSSYSW